MINRGLFLFHPSSYGQIMDTTPRVRMVDYGGIDLSKPWYVEYYVFDHSTNTIVRRKHFKGIPTTNNTTARYKQLFYWYDHYINLLKNGYTINKHTTQTASILHQPFIDVFDYVVHKKTPNIRPSTIKNWAVSRKNVVAYFSENNTELSFLNVKLQHLREMMAVVEARVKPKSYNNEVTNLRAIYNYVIKEFPEQKIINHANRLDRKKVEKGMKHLPYTTTQLKHICERLNDQELLFVMFMYYCAIRPNELRHLTVGDIMDKKLLIPATHAKNNTNEYIAIPHAMNRLIEAQKIRTYPTNYYVFSRNNIPGLELLGKGYFYNHIKKVVNELGYDAARYDLYSFKHSGVVQMHENGASMHQIMRQCRHSEIKTTAIYMVNLGLIDRNDEIMNMPDVFVN